MEMSYGELRSAMDKMFFARCVWQAADLEAVDGIEKLPDELREEFMAFVAPGLQNVMTSAGWEALADGLADFLSDHGIESDDDEYFDTEEDG